ncbi:hypothetical protein BJY59DRAFT_418769 [Rhodotorula toruloides]
MVRQPQGTPSCRQAVERMKERLEARLRREKRTGCCPRTKRRRGLTALSLDSCGAGCGVGCCDRATSVAGLTASNRPARLCSGEEGGAGAVACVAVRVCGARKREKCEVDEEKKASKRELLLDQPSTSSSSRNGRPQRRDGARTERRRLSRGTRNKPCRTRASERASERRTPPSG